MKSTNIVLLGIAIILFGAVCIGIETLIMDNEGVFEVLGIVCPFLGLVVSTLGMMKRD